MPLLAIPMGGQQFTTLRTIWRDHVWRVTGPAESTLRDQSSQDRNQETESRKSTMSQEPSEEEHQTSEDHERPYSHAGQFRSVEGATFRADHVTLLRRQWWDGSLRDYLGRTFELWHKRHGITLLLVLSLAACTPEPDLYDRPIPTPNPLAGDWRVSYRCESGCYDGWWPAQPRNLRIKTQSALLWGCVGEDAGEVTELDVEMFEMEGASTDSGGLTWALTDERGAELTAYASKAYVECEP